MKTEFESWVVLRKGSVELESYTTRGTLLETLYVATLRMKSMGAQIAEAKNLTGFKGSPSLLVSAPNFPLAVIIRGAQLTDKSGIPLQGKDSETGISSLVPAINE